jgi:hypothetical protein
MSVKITGEVFTVAVSNDGTKVNVVESPTYVSVASSGGIQGIQGIQGPTGPSGDPALLYYKHEQTTPSSTWDITHNLEFFPNITVVDSSGAVCEGEINHVTINRVTLTFSASFSGTAYLS